MTTGNVKWFDVKKGFGFIVGPEGQDVFVHFSSITGDGFKTLKDGEAVEYELSEGDKGFHAREVRRLAPRPVVTSALGAADGDGIVPRAPSRSARLTAVHQAVDGQAAAAPTQAM